MYRPFFSSFLLYSPTPSVPSVFVHTDFPASFSPDYRCNAGEGWERIANSSIFDQTAETKGNFARTRLLTDSSGKRNPYTSISIDSSTVVLLLAFLADWFPPGGDESFQTIFEYRLLYVHFVISLVDAYADVNAARGFLFARQEEEFNENWRAKSVNGSQAYNLQAASSYFYRY